MHDGDEATENTGVLVHKRRKGIYVLPNLFTLAALFGGFYAIVMAMNGRFELASIGVFCAMVLDSLDGRVARMTNTQSAFGEQMDSLSDMVSFGAAPALIAYMWALQGLGRWGWIAAFVYCACAALRLARFNTQVGVADKRYFQGLASPAAAGLCMSFVWAIEDGGLFGLNVDDVRFVTPVIAVAAGLLMVSRFRYFSFKAGPKSDRVPFVWIPIAMLILVSLAVDTPRVLFTIGVLYVLSGPVMTLWGLRQKRGSRRAARETGHDEG